MSGLDADAVIDAWRASARGDARSYAIHPSGSNERDYRASGRAAALDVVRLVAEYGGEPNVVVDYGCGDGRVAHELARIEPAWRVVGLDASPEMIDAFDARGDTIGSSAVGAVWHTGLDDAPPVEGVDVVYVYAVLIHHGWADGAAIIARLASVVRPGGLVLVDAPLYESARERTNAYDVTTWTRPTFTAAAARAECEVVAAVVDDGEFDWSVGPGPSHGRLHVLRRA